MNQANKLRTRAAILTALLLLLIPGGTVYAEEIDEPSIEDLTPNVYEKEEIQQQQDYFHEESLYEQKGEIPEELQRLQYEEPDPNKEQKQLAKLSDAFLNNEIETNNTAAQMAKAGLFTDSEEELFESAATPDLEPNENTGGSTLTILYITLIAVALLLVLLLLIPKITAGKKEEL